ncbi:sugar phosphate nucleotidyltransferase [Aquiluna sp.]|nr:sugar phosphate nucleotidyltransferase [Aquiluna sp.]
MKIVLLAGGLGTRMREETEFKPKPMVSIGGKPVLHHLMEVFSKQGFSEFVILTGYKSEVIEDYFLNFKSRNSGFTVDTGTGEVEYLDDIPSWKVTVLDTGRDSLTCDRLIAAKPLLGEEPFLLTYGDGLANVNLTGLIREFEREPTSSIVTTTTLDSRFGQVKSDAHGRVQRFAEKPESSEKINIGFFVFTREVFDFLTPNSMLESTALKNMAESGKLRSFFHNGFWMPMDTYREYEKLTQIYEAGGAPWLDIT